MNFARDFNLRLVVKSTGHDLQGRSSAPDSLLVWTHSMRDMQFHEEFVPAGGEEAASAVTLGAGLTWTDVYGAAALDRDGRSRGILPLGGLAVIFRQFFQTVSQDRTKIDL